MWKYLFLFILLFGADFAQAQSSALNDAKYLAVVKVISNHKLGDKEIAGNLEKLRESDKFKRDLARMVDKLDNNKPNDGKNRKIMRILEKAGKEIYEELR